MRLRLGISFKTLIQLIKRCLITGFLTCNFSHKIGIKFFKSKYLLSTIPSLTTSFKIRSSCWASLLTSSSKSANTLINSPKTSLNFGKIVALKDLAILYIVSQAWSLILASASLIPFKTGGNKAPTNRVAKTS